MKSVALPQGNFRSQRDDFNEGKLLQITAEALVKPMPKGQDVNTGFLVRDEDFFVSGSTMSLNHIAAFPLLCSHSVTVTLLSSFGEGIVFWDCVRVSPR